MPKTLRERGAPDAVYMALVERFPLRPIRSEDELAEATEIVLDLAPRPDLGRGEEDYLDTLTMLVKRYEDEHHPVHASFTPAERLRNLIEARGVSAYRLAADLGISQGTISEILSGKRGISAANREKFAGYFRVKPSAFI